MDILLIILLLLIVIVSYRALELAISICKPGVMYREIGNVIGKYIEE